MVVITDKRIFNDPSADLSQPDGLGDIWNAVGMVGAAGVQLLPSLLGGGGSSGCGPARELAAIQAAVQQAINSLQTLLEQAQSGNAASVLGEAQRITDGGVPKSAVLSAQVTRDGWVGDRQRNRKYHGGPDRAVCLFSLEVIDAHRAEGHSIGPGSSGENLTLAGLDWSLMRPGDRLRIGEQVRLEMTSYTTPCRYNAQWFKDGDYERIAQETHPGWSRLYARVLHEGTVRPGDPVVLESDDLSGWGDR